MSDVHPLVPPPSTAHLLDELPLPDEAERIYVDTSNLAELKSTCDDAVERILTRSNRALLAPPVASSSHTPTSDASPNSPLSASSSSSLLASSAASAAAAAASTSESTSKATTDASAAPADEANDKTTAAADDFPPFRVSHLHADLRLALGFVASSVMIGTSAWSYLVEKEWQNNKHACGVAVVVFLVLSAIQAADAYMQGYRIFVGRRKMLSKRIENERLVISSPPLDKPQVMTLGTEGAATTTTPPPKSSAGKGKSGSGGGGAKGKSPSTPRTGAPAPAGFQYTVPPRYVLDVEYTRKSNGGKSLLREVKQRVDLGHLGEWFTAEGEFVEAIFEAKLLSGLQSAIGR